MTLDGPRSVAIMGGMSNANPTSKPALTCTDLDTFAAILVSSMCRTIGFSGNAAYWTARAAEHAPFGTDADIFAAHVTAAATAAGKLLSPGPSLVCAETLPDGSAPVRLSFAVKVF